MDDSDSNEDVETSVEKSKKATYTNRDLQILKELLDTLEDGKIRKQIESGITSNDRRNRIWKTVTRHFNLATNKQLTQDQVRKKYHRMKAAGRKVSDNIAVDRQMKKLCAKTGGGRGPTIPPDEDGDNMDQDDDLVDNFANEYGGFTRANAPLVLADHSNLTISSITPTIQEIFSQPVSAMPIEPSDIIQPSGSISRLPLSNSRRPSQSGRQSQTVRQSLTPLPGRNTEKSPVSVVQSSELISQPFSSLVSPRSVDRSFDSVSQSSGVSSPPCTSNLQQNENIPQNEQVLIMQTENSQITRVDRVDAVRVPTGNSKKPSASEKGKSKATTKQNPRQPNVEPPSKKEEAATQFYKQMLKQKTCLNKLQANLLYMKGCMMENHLVENGIQYQVPYPQVNFEMDSSESEPDDF